MLKGGRGWFETVVVVIVADALFRRRKLAEAVGDGRQRLTEQKGAST